MNLLVFNLVSRKAVSPIITVVLLTVFTVSIGSMITSWTFDYTKTTTNAVTETATGPKGIIYCANSNVEISNVVLKNQQIAANTSVLSGDTNYFDLTSVSGTPTITFTGVAGASYVDNLAGWWHFDNDVLDSSGTGNDGVLGSTIYNTSGKFSQALQFDGDDNVTVADDASLDMTDTITLSAWVNVNNESIPWHLDGWSKRQIITINQTSELLTNFQIKKTIIYNSSMQADFDDLRFTTMDGINIPYWIENKTDSVAADIWLKIPQISNVSTTKILQYYENSSVSDESNSSEVFEFFDDFDGNLIDNWFVASNAGYTLAEIISEELVVHRTVDWNYIMAAIASNASFAKNMPLIIQYNHKFVGSSPWGGCANQMKVMLTSFSDTVTRKAYDSGGCDWQGHPTSNYSWLWNNVGYGDPYEMIEIYLNGSGQMKIVDDGVPGSWQAIPNWDTINDSGFNLELICMGSGGGGGNDYCYYDNVRIRKYSPNDIIGYSDGLVETQSVVSKIDAYGINLNNTHAIGIINDQTITASINAGWNHIALTYDKNVGTPQMKLYINGAEQTTANYATAITTNTNDLVIGNAFIGTIDEVRIYNRTLSSSEITATYNTATLSTTTTNPKASINDNVNIIYTGTLTNGATATLTINSDNFTVGENNITIYTDAGVVDYEISMNGLSVLVSNTGMNEVTVKQVIAFKTDGTNCIFQNSNKTFDVGDFFKVSGCPMSCDEFTTVKAYTDCTGIFGEYTNTPNRC